MEKYQDGLKEFEDAIRSGKTDVSLPPPPDEVSNFVIRRKVLVKLNPIDYAPNSSTAQWQIDGDKVTML